MTMVSLKEMKVRLVPGELGTACRSPGIGNEAHQKCFHSTLSIFLLVNLRALSCPWYEVIRRFRAAASSQTAVSVRVSGPGASRAPSTGVAGSRA